MRIGYLPPDSIARFTADGFYIEEEGKEVAIKYGDLAHVFIGTTDQGPWIPDSFWVLRTSNGKEVVIETGDPSAMVLLGALQKALPSLDNGASCASSFVVCVVRRRSSCASCVVVRRVRRASSFVVCVV
jgi:hypothetical protein